MNKQTSPQLMWVKHLASHPSVWMVQYNMHKWCWPVYAKPIHHYSYACIHQGRAGAIAAPCVAIPLYVHTWLIY